MRAAPLLSTALSAATSIALILGGCTAQPGDQRAGDGPSSEGEGEAAGRDGVDGAAAPRIPS